MEEEKQRYVPELPLDVLPGILSRVPAESLVRFKCVCKTWYGLISDQGFVRSHLEHWRSAGHVLISGDPLGWERKIYRIKLNLEDQEAQSHRDEICIPELPMPVHRDYVGVELHDSCGGLLLLEIIDRHSTARAQQLLVCNPITKWYMLLPPCPSFKLSYCRWKIASDDPVQRYKIIGIKPQSHSESPSGWCFNLEFRRRESGTWKELLPADIPWSGYSWVFRPSLSVGRKVHWLALRDAGELVLLSLDVSTERLTLTETSKLQFSYYYSGPNWFLSDRVMCFGRRIESSKEIEVWTLEDFDGRPVWRKHHVVRNYPQGLDFPTSDYDLEAMLYMDEEDELIMRIGVGTFLYKMSSREWRRIGTPADGDFQSMITYNLRRHVNSLVGFGRRTGTICC